MKQDFYEMTYILNPVLDEERFKELVSFIHKLIADNGGEVAETDEWGAKKLAYDIDGKGTGYYVNLYFNAPAPAIEVVERAMRISDDVLRYITLKYDAKMLRHYELRKKGELPQFFVQDEDEPKEDDN